MAKSHKGKVTDLLYEGEDYVLAKLAIKLIEIPKDRFRAIHTDGSLQALRATLDTLPLLNEIGVREKNGKYELIYGESRFKQFKEQGKDQIPAKIWKVNTEQALLMQVAENYARGSYDPVKLIDIITRLVDSGKWKGKDIARLLNTSETAISKLIALKEYPDSVKMMIAKGDLDIETAYEMHLESDPDKLNALSKVILTSHFNRDAAREYVRHHYMDICDNCGVEHCQRDHLGYQQFNDKWLCDKCMLTLYPEEYQKLKAPRPEAGDLTQAATAGMQPEKPASIPAEAQPSAPAEAKKPKPPEMFKCDVCNHSFIADDMRGLSMCSEDASRFYTFYRRYEATVGQSLWTTPISTLEKMRIVLGE